ncbi:MAG TPA: peptidoglycan-binding domain-containing protein [Candidatus Paceibacterota bacterium]|nr:peptidoglycan-binding domain-containing protein [Candidatus Paceibacterota bacterium]
MKKRFSSKIFIIFLFLAVILPTIKISPAKADYVGQINSFYINSDYDSLGRQKISAQAILVSDKLYIYADSDWWLSMSALDRENLYNNLYNLVDKFEKKDYFLLTQTFGSEANPGIDGDSHIVVLLHKMKNNVTGYTRLADSLSQNQVANSNQREMIYLDSTILTNPQSLSLAPYYLAHEFVHLISFNQKDYNKEEAKNDIWLSEARAEYAATLLGYPDVLTERKKQLAKNPSVSLLDWQESSNQYAAVNIFAHYLVDQYGLRVLTDSLKFPLFGVDSLNEALRKNGYLETTTDVFKNFSLAVLLNDCSANNKYCFKNPQLRDFTIYPLNYYLPDSGLNNLSASLVINPWAVNVLKITGGDGALKINFSYPADAEIYLYYVIVDANNKTVKFWDYHYGYNGNIYVSNLSNGNSAIYFLPLYLPSPNSNKFHTSLFNFSISSITEEQKASLEKEDELKIIKSLTELLEQLKNQVAILTAQLNNLRNLNINKLSTESVSCTTFQKDLYYGMENSWEVKCLQTLLKEKEPSLYPSGLVTGNYLELTKQAVQKYQQKYGLPQTGYFGPLTRELANSQWFK